MPDLGAHDPDVRSHRLPVQQLDLCHARSCDFLNDRLVRRGIRNMAGSRQEKESP